MSISREEKEKLVIDHYFNQGKTFRYIAEHLRLSFTSISQIVKKHQDEIDGKSNNTITIEKKTPQLSLSSKAYKMFSEGRTNVQVAIKAGYTTVPSNSAQSRILEITRPK